MSGNKSAESPSGASTARTDGRTNLLRRIRFRRPGSGVIAPDGTWVDRSAPGTRDLIARGRELELQAQQAEIEAKAAARRHYLRMQKWILLGVGMLILLTIVALVLGLSLNVINGDFATELARIMLPILLGAATTIVGAFFGFGSTVNPNSEDGRRAFDTPGRRRRWTWRRRRPEPLPDEEV